MFRNTRLIVGIIFICTTSLFLTTYQFFGLKYFIEVPKAIRQGEAYPKGIEIIEVRSLDQALNAALKKSEK